MSENPFDIKALDDGLIWYRINLNSNSDANVSPQIKTRINKLLAMGPDDSPCSLQPTKLSSESSSIGTGPSQLQTKTVLDKLTKPQLQKLAKSFDVPAPTTLSKAELVDTLLTHPTQKQIGGSSDRRVIHNDPAAKTLALLKLQDLAKQYHLLKPGKKLPVRSQKAIKECCTAAEISLNSYLSTPTGQKLLNQKGGYIGGLSQAAFWGLTIGGTFLLGSVIALIIYLNRRRSIQQGPPQTPAEFFQAVERAKGAVAYLPGEHLIDQGVPQVMHEQPIGQPGFTQAQPLLLRHHQPLPPPPPSAPSGIYAPAPRPSGRKPIATPRTKLFPTSPW